VSWRGWAVAAGLVGAVISAALVIGARAAAAPTADVRAGQALYATHCAACHGETGQGDGPSAAGFATKPANLTDGRVLNPLPDEFLASVIRGGGPAEGLSPTMPPFGRLLSETQLQQVIRYVRSLARPAFDPAQAQRIVAVPGAPGQPIFFSHLIHAGSFGIACQYCHADARRSDYAGLPSVERCMGCHKIIGAQDNPEIAKIHDHWNRGVAIPWVRVYKVPEFTRFPHKAHVRAGVECQRCHGHIERMRVVGAHTGRALGDDLTRLVGLAPPQRPLTMGWCVDCHRTENARPDRRDIRAPLDCVACHH
jgi:mono/diheme cytochrome c family protein